MEIIGFILGILIGVSLGLIGSGGSILSIPILVYILNISPSNATTYSLFIVGISALVGSLKGAKDKLLDFKMALYFGLPSIVSIFFMRKFFVPLLPNNLFSIGDFMFSKDICTMLLFSILMIVASFSMIQKGKFIKNENLNINYINLIFRGLFVGLLTGFVGIGGGFLIIPTLLFSAHLPMKKAVATSLIIIAFNSLIGFAGSIENTKIEWEFLLEFTAFSVVGIFVGMYLSKKIPNEKLKPAFGWFVLITGIYVIVKELIVK